MKNYTTIPILIETKERLTAYKQQTGNTYDDLVSSMLDMVDEQLKVKV